MAVVEPGSTNQTITLALQALIQSATDLANDAQVLNSQGSTNATDATALGAQVIIADIANSSRATAYLSTILAGPNGADNQTVSVALEDAIGKLTKMAVDTVAENMRIANRTKMAVDTVVENMRIANRKWYNSGR
jgi:hypothetical protein